MKDIMEVLRACGYAAEGAQSMEFDSDALEISNPRKRTKGKDPSDRPNREISSKIIKTSNALDESSKSLTFENGSSLQRDETGAQESSILYSDDYWDLDAYWNQVTYSQLLKDTVDQSQTSLPFPSLGYPLQDELLMQEWPSDVINWDMDDIAGTIDQGVNFEPLDLTLSTVPARNSSMDDWTETHDMR